MWGSGSSEMRNTDRCTSSQRLGSPCPVTCIWLWRSLVAHLLGEQVVGGSNPLSQTHDAILIFACLLRQWLREIAVAKTRATYPETARIDERQGLPSSR